MHEPGPSDPHPGPLSDPVPSVLDSAPDTGTTYRCNCMKYCKGILQHVSRRKYKLHAPFRVRPEDVLAGFVPFAHRPLVPPAARSADAWRRHAHSELIEHDPTMPTLTDSDDEMDEEDEDGDGDEDHEDNRGVEDHEGDDDNDNNDDDAAGHLTPGERSSSSPRTSHSNHALDPPPPAYISIQDDVDDYRDDPAVPEHEPEPEFGQTEDVGAPQQAHRQEIREAQSFIRALHNAKLDDGGMSQDSLARMREPRCAPVEVSSSERVGLRMFTALGDASEENYADNRAAFMEFLPDSAIPTYDQVKKLVSNITGLEAIHTDMCVNTCVAYVGPFGKYEQCPFCGLSRSPLNDDMVLMFSLDGAQLYESKSSDCWFLVWVLFDLPPTARYKKRYVLPGAVIGGPKKPKNVDSFIFPSLYHLAALQCEGLAIWDAAENRLFRSYLFLLLVTADGPAMAYLNGLVGHQGAHGCRLYCEFLGRNKPGMAMYYPAALRPTGAPPSEHPDQSLRAPPLATLPAGSAPSPRSRYDMNLKVVTASRTNAEYARNRLATGIAKPSIFSGLPRMLGVPDAFGADLMHLVCLNLTDLIMGLLRGSLVCEQPDDKSTWNWAVFADRDTWHAHGRLVAEATRYLPGSFDRPPRNPAEKISSGYKAWEFLLYVYGLLPGLLRAVQAPLYYRHFCKLVAAVRIILQRRITPEQLPLAHRNFIEHAEGIETLYYQRRIERLHFVRQSIHATTHIVPEISRLGPGTLYTQWTLENYIGNITREIKQHSTPYANVSERARRRCQVNALKALIPSLVEEPALPRGAYDLGEGYVLLRAFDSRQWAVPPAESLAIHSYMNKSGHPMMGTWLPLVRRWARLRLPNGQIARTAWKECVLESRGRALRRARMVKLTGTPSRFVEVQYFFLMDIGGARRALAMVAPFSPPDAGILAESENTLLACTPPGADQREVLDVADLAAVIAMVPLPPTAAESAHEDLVARFFVVEKPGLDVALLGGQEQGMENIDEDLDV
ncbi:hypothetical protein BN946_scf184983.g26 [Trametes cinnabarina]|uniref:Transposase family Tnp2 protein n=1 Tax=Pycnoporus cinnabarinus TaxID=5643 RepID=A0A060SJB9_PYCCI|nr:hypothetical protein BN946_scf184983.g26 [Trametes cinnabarina]